jgi:hypothetical protein
MTELEKELEDVIGKAVAEPVKPTPLRTVPPPPAQSLTQQWDTLAKIESELRTRIRRERGMITAEHDRLWTETRTDYDRRIDEAVAKLESERQTALRTLADQTAAKLREHDLLKERMG